MGTWRLVLSGALLALLGCGKPPDPVVAKGKFRSLIERTGEWRVLSWAECKPGHSCRVRLRYRDGEWCEALLLCWDNPGLLQLRVYADASDTFKPEEAPRAYDHLLVRRGDGGVKVERWVANPKHRSPFYHDEPASTEEIQRWDAPSRDLLDALRASMR
jgi:hypothetical protein